MINTFKIRENFSRASFIYEKYADLQRDLSCELISRIQKEKLNPGFVLDIGAGTGVLDERLKKSFKESKIIGLDISPEMLAQVRKKGIDCVAADASALPFLNDSFDLVLSNASYQWVRPLAKAFFEARNILAPQGVFLFNCFGAQTLKEIRSCFNILQNELPDKEMINSALRGAGYSFINIQSRLIRKTFEDLKTILNWLKCVGANRIYDFHIPMSAGKLDRLSMIYKKDFSQGAQKVYATFEVIWVRAVK